MAEFLNNNIKYLRSLRGISQQGLADKVGIDRSTVSRIENNEIETTIDNAIKIAEALDVSLYELVGKDLTIDYEPPVENNEEKYKQILREKGIMDDNGIIDDEKLNEFNKKFEMIDRFSALIGEFNNRNKED